ncbi:M23 family metallopeptidase [Bacteroides thetaiotaomicron]|nr:M23 family metallopeptidase [Bacteroides thetaiotaomicron]
MHGEVIKVGKDKRSGLYVTLRHGDFTVSYCHLSQTLVTKGATSVPASSSR